MVGMEQEVQLEEAAGRMVNLSCEVQSYPRPVVSWNIVGSQVDFFCVSLRTSSFFWILFWRDCRSLTLVFVLRAGRKW